MSNIPQELNDIATFLANKKIRLPEHGTDSRADSANAENYIVSILQNGEDAHGCKIRSPNLGEKTNRAWYDFKANDKYYCDIKVSELKTNDNTNAKKAIYYFLTGQEPVGVSDTEKIFFKELKKNESPDESRDYYYFVVNKNDTSDIFIVSLRGVAKLSPSSNNPPFQCRWDECRNNKKRDWQQAKGFLLGCWAESIKRKIENAKKGMPDYYPEFFDFS